MGANWAWLDRPSDLHFAHLLQGFALSLIDDCASPAIPTITLLLLFSSPRRCQAERLASRRTKSPSQPASHCYTTTSLPTSTMASLQGHTLASLPPAAAPPVRRARFQRQRTGCQPPHALLPSTAELLLATLSTLPGDTGLETFEPLLPGPAIAVAAAAAATPPILFWARIFQSAERRQRAIEAEQAAEQERQRQREVRGWRAEVWAAGCALGNSRFQACDPVATDLHIRHHFHLCRS